MVKKVVYFAHPVSHYNTLVEEKCIEVIITNLDVSSIDFELVNPNNQLFQNVYDNRKKNDHPDRFQFFLEIVEGCDYIIGSTFMDGKIGFGVYGEMEHGLMKSKRTYLIDTSTPIYSFFPILSKSIFDMNYKHRVLDYHETVDRIRDNIQ